ncbi:MAG: hypothetical protein Q9P01_00800 [Anaerolineae bacterium]|nr:hypothetical protein [Anaerolineae bacterium]MDQ7033406.1 hypothetical protein [Anaerolineae bacterium]
MSKARERQKKRRQQQEMVRRSDGRMARHQTRPQDSFQLPQINLPGGRWLWLIPLSIVVLVAVVVVLGLINPPDDITPPNAIWLNADWSYSEPSTETVQALTSQFQENNIGRLFIYTSSLKADGTWSGLVDDRNRFNEVDDRLSDLVLQIREVAPQLELYAWVEITTTTSSGYRLDNLQIHNTIGNFSTLMVNEIGFDGVLLDVKPIFEENEDLLTMMRSVRAKIGLDTPMLVVVPADLTPTDTSLILPAQIAPGTEWSAEFKQRVALQADQIVITAYNSYHTSPVDYIEWVSYQVEAFAAAMTEFDTGATILVSVPVYEENLPAHDGTIESLAGALDGVRRGVSRLELGTEMPLFAGVAIFADHRLTDSEWSIFSDKWGNQN